VCWLISRYSWEANRSSDSQEILRILWNWRFVAAITKAFHQSFPEPDQSSPHLQPTSWRSGLILFSIVRLLLLSGLFSSGFLTTTQDVPVLSPQRASCPTHLVRLDFIPCSYTQKISVHIRYKILFLLFFWYRKLFIDRVTYFRIPKDHGVQHTARNLTHFTLCLYQFAETQYTCNYIRV
jgi:hypothetical protein